MSMTRYAAAALLTAVVPFSAQALVLTGASSSYGESVNLTLTTLAGSTPLMSGPLPTLGGTAPGPYNLSALALSSSVFGALTTGVLTVSVQSNVDGTAGNRSAFAIATVSDLLLSLGANSFLASAIVSTANVAGDSGALLAAGTTTLADASFNGAVPANLTPAANTALPLGLPGVSVVLNEQIFGGDGVTSRSVEVNGLHATFTNFGVAGVGTLNGDIIIAHSQASLTALPVPEPATLSMFGVGVAGLLAAVRRRRAPAHAA